ncbi:MAG: DUF333 domain-containing protein [Myxococcota bacterium]|nr:DUF333 domain-containing protein [Myxococcota bacterium]
MRTSVLRIIIPLAALGWFTVIAAGCAENAHQHGDPSVNPGAAPAEQSGDIKAFSAKGEAEPAAEAPQATPEAQAQPAPAAPGAAAAGQAPAAAAPATAESVQPGAAPVGDPAAKAVGAQSDKTSTSKPNTAVSADSTAKIQPVAKTKVGDEPKDPAIKPGMKPGAASMPNPAAKGCIEKGGAYKIVDSDRGQTGLCMFRDGSRCEAWRLFRGQCKPGECKKPSGICD